MTKRFEAPTYKDRQGFRRSEILSEDPAGEFVRYQDYEKLLDVAVAGQKLIFSLAEALAVQKGKGLLLEALEEALCWFGAGMNASSAGAQCDTLGEARKKCIDAIAKATNPDNGQV